MTAKEFKKKNRLRMHNDRCCGNCGHFVQKTWQDGLETRCSSGCTANGDGKKVFATFNWWVCDAWDLAEEGKRK